MLYWHITNYSHQHCKQGLSKDCTFYSMNTEKGTASFRFLFQQEGGTWIDCNHDYSGLLDKSLLLSVILQPTLAVVKLWGKKLWGQRDLSKFSRLHLLKWVYGVHHGSASPVFFPKDTFCLPKSAWGSVRQCQDVQSRPADRKVQNSFSAE